MTHVTHAQKGQHSRILGANQMPMCETEKLGTTCNQKLMMRHQKLRSNQIASRGTMRVNTESFAQVMKEQEHNLFAQSVRGMTGVQYTEREAVVMAQIIEQVTRKYSLAQQYMLHKGLKKFGEAGERAIGKEVGQLHNYLLGSV